MKPKLNWNIRMTDRGILNLIYDLLASRECKGVSIPPSGRVIHMTPYIANGSNGLRKPRSHTKPL